MGKTTKHHPISLPILRESARICSYRLGRIHQDAISEDQFSARYTVEILQCPIEFGGALPQQIAAALNTCYSSDVWIERCWFTKSDRIFIEMVTTTNVLNASRPAKQWLQPLSSAELSTLLDETPLYISKTDLDWLLDDEETTGEEL